jgi:hypothetical protein
MNVSLDKALRHVKTNKELGRLICLQITKLFPEKEPSDILGMTIQVLNQRFNKGSYEFVRRYITEPHPYFTKEWYDWFRDPSNRRHGFILNKEKLSRIKASTIRRNIKALEEMKCRKN